jgi:hypothetical protein
VTQSSARASQEIKDSTVLVSGSVPPSDSEEAGGEVLPSTQPTGEQSTTTDSRKSSTPVRPAAGQPPSASVLIAKPPPVVALPSPQSHREVTQPARSRLTPMTQLTHLAQSAGRQQNLVLWVLGAAGWVVAGVLAGVLIARGDPQPAAPPSPSIVVVPRADGASPPSLQSAHAGEAPSIPVERATDLPVELVPPQQTNPNLVMRPQAAGPKGAGVLAAPAASAPSITQPGAETRSPGQGDTINSPGF